MADEQTTNSQREGIAPDTVSVTPARSRGTRIVSIIASSSPLTKKPS
jgi:hypothetical protein